MERINTQEIRPSLLLSLPGELRNQIYSLVLANQSKIVISSLPGSDQIAHRNADPQLQLLQVSRTVRAETLPVYYGWNTFQILDAIKCLDAALDWLDHIHPSNRALLKRVEVPTFDAPKAVEGMRRKGFQLTHPMPATSADFFAPKWLTFRCVSVGE